MKWRKLVQKQKGENEDHHKSSPKAEVTIQEICYIFGSIRTLDLHFCGKWGWTIISMCITKIYLRSDTVCLCLSKTNSLAATDEDLLSRISLCFRRKLPLTTACNINMGSVMAKEHHYFKFQIQLHANNFVTLADAGRQHCNRS